MKKTAILVMVLILITGMTAAAAAEKLTARALGMGGAYTAVAQDISTILYNPAGMTRSGAFSVHGSMGVMVSDFDQYQDTLDLVDYLQDDFSQDQVEQVEAKLPQDLRLEGQNFLGGNFKNLGFALNFTDSVRAAENDKDISVQPDLKNTAQVEGMVSFSKKVLSPAADIAALSYGVNLKYGKRREDHFELNYDKNNPTNSKLVSIAAEGTGFGTDVGLLIKTTDLIRIGVQVENLIATGYSLKGEKTVNTYSGGSSWSTDTSSDWSKEVDAASKMTVGAAVKVPVLDATLALDLENFPILSEGDMYTRMGLAKDMFFDGLTLRAGTYKKPDQERMYTAGLGLNMTKFHIDAAVGTESSFNENQLILISGSMNF